VSVELAAGTLANLLGRHADAVRTGPLTPRSPAAALSRNG